MKISMLVFLCVLSCVQGFAQQAPLNNRAVYLETFGQDQVLSGPDLKNAKLFLGKQQVSISGIQNVSVLPLHIVFVIDRARHQGPLAQLALNYVSEIAESLPSGEMTLTVLLAGKIPRVVAEANSGPALVAELKKIQLIQQPDRQAEGLYDGASKAMALLHQSPGVRNMVIFSDDDDDINGKRLDELKLQVASAHIRCYSVLIADRGFYGTKARAASGIRLAALARFSGGAEYETHWEKRRSDTAVLRSLASRISHGSLITFSLPEHLSVKPGIYNLRVHFGIKGQTMKTTPFVLAP